MKDKQIQKSGPARVLSGNEAEAREQGMAVEGEVLQAEHFDKADWTGRKLAEFVSSVAEGITLAVGGTAKLVRACVAGVVDMASLTMAYKAIGSEAILTARARGADDATIYDLTQEAAAKREAFRQRFVMALRQRPNPKFGLKDAKGQPVDDDAKRYLPALTLKVDVVTGLNIEPPKPRGTKGRNSRKGVIETGGAAAGQASGDDKLPEGAGTPEGWQLAVIQSTQRIRNLLTIAPNVEMAKKYAASICTVLAVAGELESGYQAAQDSVGDELARKPVAPEAGAQA